MNKVILIGRLTADPEMRQTTNGTSVATFAIMTVLEMEVAEDVAD